MRTREAATLVSGVLLLLSAAVLAPVIGGCGAGSSLTSPVDLPMILLGGYSFWPNSAKIKHTWIVVSPSTGKMTYAGYGGNRGRSMTLTFSNGGSVRGVATVRFLSAQTVGNSHSAWAAQDQAGNIHDLRMQSGMDPAQLAGVATGGKPWFFLPRSSVLKPGYVWYGYQGGKAKERSQVLSVSASMKGKTGLLYVQTIWDENGDGKFSPTWGGKPDYRADYYFDRNHGLYVMQTDASSGFVRK
jgi:hypothetical protein